MLSFINRLFGRADGEVSGAAAEEGRPLRRKRRWLSKRRERGDQRSKCGAAIEGGIVMVSPVLYSFLILFCFILIISFVNSSIEDRGRGGSGRDGGGGGCNGSGDGLKGWGDAAALRMRRR